VLICTLIISCRAANLASPAPAGAAPGAQALKEFIGTGAWNTCGLTNKGYLECFGSTVREGIPILKPLKPKEGSTFTQVSVGSNHICGLTNLGGIECVGGDRHNKGNNKKTKRPTNGGKFVQVSSGKHHTCGVTSDGGIECFGYIEAILKAPQKENGEKFIQVSSGFFEICGLTNKRVIECYERTETAKDGEKTLDFIKAEEAKDGKFIQVSVNVLHDNAFRDSFFKRDFKWSLEKQKKKQGEQS
jgi:hypothetical protein